MKRQAQNHPKLQLLARDLSIDLCYARGVAESLWLVTATCFPDGGIGRWSNEEIAVGLGYSGEAEALVAALRKRKLLDDIPAEAGRLYVHDWHVHADDAVHIQLYRRADTFANGALPRPTRLSKEERKNPSRRGPYGRRTNGELVPTGCPPIPTNSHQCAQPEPVINSIIDSESGIRSSDADAVFARARGRPPAAASSSSSCYALLKPLAAAHPVRSSLKAAVCAYELAGSAASAQLTASHAAYVAYWARAQPEYIPPLDRWITDGDWERTPEENEALNRKPPGREAEQKAWQAARQQVETERQAEADARQRRENCQVCHGSGWQHVRTKTGLEGSKPCGGCRVSPKASGFAVGHAMGLAVGVVVGQT